MQAGILLGGALALGCMLCACKFTPASEGKNVGRAGKRLLEITDVAHALRRAVARYELSGNVEDLARLIKSGHPQDVTAAITAFKKVVHDQAQVVKGRIEQLVSKIGSENTHVNLNAANVNWIAIMGERRANIDGINDALAKLIKKFEQHKVAAASIAGDDQALLRRLTVGIDDGDYHKVFAENFAERKVMNISPSSGRDKTMVQDAQSAVVARLDRLDKMLDETFVAPLKNAFATAARNAEFTGVRQVIETAVNSGQARRVKSYFRRLFDINSTAPAAYYRSYTDKIAAQIEDVVLSKIPQAKSSAALAQLLDDVSRDLDRFAVGVKSRGATLQQIAAAEGSTDFLKNITDDLHLIANTKLNKLSNVRSTPLGGTHYRNNYWPATLEYNLMPAIPPSLKQGAGEVRAVQKKLKELEQLCRQHAC